MNETMGPPAMTDSNARYYQLDERVTNLRSSVTHLETQMTSGFNSINQSLSGLNEQLRHGQKTQWPVIWSAAGVMFAVLAGVGAILYTPIKADLERLESNTLSRTEWDTNQVRAAETRARLENVLLKLSETSMPRSELTLMAEESRADRRRLGEEINALESESVTRAEWSERNRARDQEILDIARRISELQQSVASTYNLRDVIVDLKEQVRTLERRSGP